MFCNLDMTTIQQMLDLRRLNSLYWTYSTERKKLVIMFTSKLRVSYFTLLYTFL